MLVRKGGNIMASEIIMPQFDIFMRNMMMTLLIFGKGILKALQLLGGF